MRPVRGRRFHTERNRKAERGSIVGQGSQEYSAQQTSIKPNGENRCTVPKRAYSEELKKCQPRAREDHAY